MTIKAGIIGGTGYGGAELLRLLAAHPDISINFATSRGEERRTIADVWSTLGYIDLSFQHPDDVDYASVDVVFSAAPNGVAMQHARAIVEAGTRLIDLSADFRFKDPKEYQRWYKTEHACPELLDEAVYTIPELVSEQMDTARIFGCAGCYATTIQLGIAPALVHHFAKDGHPIIADGKSGVSGAGKTANVANLHAEVSENFRAYNASAHRHGPEIANGLYHATNSRAHIVFVPHLIPMVRGIEASIYINTNGESTTSIHKAYESFYTNHRFVEVLPWGSHPETRMVRGTNNVLISLHQQEDSDVLIVLAVVDNLVKGAAGQAVQACNLAFGLDETTGLAQHPLGV